MSGRCARNFVLGFPYLVRGGVYYTWPSGEFVEHRRVFEEHRIALGKHLLEQAQNYMNRFEFRDTPYYPYLDSGMKFETIHIGVGGRWLEFGVHSPGSGMISCHNVDGCSERVMAFNLTSDSLEFLDTSVVAPRIIPHELGHEISYPLASRVDMPEHFYNEEWINRFNCGQFIRASASERRIEFVNGIIDIGEDRCVGVGFDRFFVERASFLIAKIADSFCL